jgi:hypothetical protein
MNKIVSKNGVLLLVPFVVRMLMYYNNLLVSQFNPLYPYGHSQIYVPRPIMHRPPFLQVQPTLNATNEQNKIHVGNEKMSFTHHKCSLLSMVDKYN